GAGCADDAASEQQIAVNALVKAGCSEETRPTSIRSGAVVTAGVLIPVVRSPLARRQYFECAERAARHRRRGGCCVTFVHSDIVRRDIGRIVRNVGDRLQFSLYALEYSARPKGGASCGSRQS